MPIVPSALNGNFPSLFMATMPGSNGDGSPHIADRLAVQSYWRLSQMFRDAGMGWLLPSDGWSCYRTRADQAHMRNLGLTTIPVGQSIHGEAGGKAAVDYAGLPFGSARHNWMKVNAGQHGWYQPSWAQVGGSLPESWHWEYDSRSDQHINDNPITPEDDMTQQDVNDIKASLANLSAYVFNGGGDVPNSPGGQGSLLALTKQVLTNVNGLPDILRTITLNTNGLPDVIAVLDGKVVAVGANVEQVRKDVEEIAGVLWEGTPGTPPELTMYARVVRIEKAVVK